MDREGDAPREPASVDTMFEALASPHRRRVLLAVREGDDVRYEEEFATHSLASPRLGEREPDILRLLLYHSHLPRLADVGYVEWSPDEGVVRRGPHFDEIEPLLDLLAEHEGELPSDFP